MDIQYQSMYSLGYPALFLRTYKVCNTNYGYVYLYMSTTSRCFPTQNGTISCGKFCTKRPIDYSGDHIPPDLIIQLLHIYRNPLFPKDIKATINMILDKIEQYPDNKYLYVFFGVAEALIQIDTDLQNNISMHQIRSEEIIRDLP